jgi:hypothetical protein
MFAERLGKWGPSGHKFNKWGHPEVVDSSRKSGIKNNEVSAICRSNRSKNASENRGGPKMACNKTSKRGNAWPVPRAFGIPNLWIDHEVPTKITDLQQTS